MTLVIPEPKAIADFVGTDLGVSGWVAIEQSRIDAFANATDDHQWIHTDVERAGRESPFGGTVAHGYLTLSLAPALLRQLLEIRGCRSVVNTGIERMRLSAPVPAGSRVRMSAAIRDARELPGGGVRTAFALRFEVEGNPRPACIANVIYVYFP